MCRDVSLSDEFRDMIWDVYFDNSGEKVFEVVSSKMYMGYEVEELDNGVFGCLFEVFYGGGVVLVGGGIEFYMVVSEVFFFFGELFGVVGEIRKNEVVDDGDDESNNILENEELFLVSKILEGVSEECVVWRREVVVY